MLSTWISASIALLTLLVFGYDTLPTPTPSVNVSEISFALTDGLAEVKSAIALKEKIIARGHDLNKDPIPEFEEQLPNIFSFYQKAFNDNPKKMSKLERRMQKMHALFRQNKVYLSDWNKFHVFLNDLLVSDNPSESGATGSFDKLICFVYRESPAIGVQARNLADAHDIWLLQMPGTPEVKLYGRSFTPSEFTNTLYPFRNPFEGKDTLKNIYAAIERIESLQDRAIAHLSLYSLLRQSRYRTFEYIEPGQIQQRFLVLRDELVGELKMRSFDRTHDVYRALMFEGEDSEIEITTADDKTFVVTGEAKGAVYRYVVNATTGDDDILRLEYTDREGKLKQSAKVRLRLIKHHFDPSPLRLMQALGLDVQAKSFAKQFVDQIDTFIATLPNA